MHANGRTALTLAATLAALAGSGAVADTPSAYDSYADVVSVTPRYRWLDVVEPVRRCERVPVAVTSGYPPGYAPRSYAGTAGDVYEVHDAPRPRRGVGAGIVGGLIGGLIGNQFGGGSGKAALTVAGAALGASIARDGVRHGHPVAVPGRRYVEPTRYVTERCTETRESRLVRQLDGYDVAYRFHGQTFRKWVAEHPGERVAIHVTVQPDPAP